MQNNEVIIYSNTYECSNLNSVIRNIKWLIILNLETKPLSNVSHAVRPDAASSRLCPQTLFIFRPHAG